MNSGHANYLKECAKVELSDLTEELSLVNRAYAHLSAGNKSTSEERKKRQFQLTERKKELSAGLIPAIDSYLEALELVKAYKDVKPKPAKFY